MVRKTVSIALFLLSIFFVRDAVAQEEQWLRIMSYNIHHANPPSKPGSIDLDAIARVITESKADIVALQEVDLNTKRSGKLNEAKLIAEKTGMRYHFFKAIDHDGGEYGLAILSKLPLKKLKLERLPQKVKAEERILAMATIKTGKQKFIFANTHLDASKDHANRNLQMQHILGHFRDEKLPVVLCGDLNSVAGSDAINLLDTAFKRTCIDNCAGTVPVETPRRTIDYIATKNWNWWLETYDVIAETYASDHRPIIATFKIR